MEHPSQAAVVILTGSAVKCRAYALRPHNAVHPDWLTRHTLRFRSIAGTRNRPSPSGVPEAKVRRGSQRRSTPELE